MKMIHYCHGYGGLLFILCANAYFLTIDVQSDKCHQSPTLHQRQRLDGDFVKLLLRYLLNVRSLNENLNKLEVFVQSLYNKPTIIVCTETWIIQHIEYFQLSGYNIYYNSRKINRADGVVLYIRKDISHEINVIEIDRI